MMKFFRKHRKAVSPVIAVMLLVAVAVAAVGAYFIWFRSFQTQTQKSVQETSAGALGQGLQVISMTDDGSNYYVVMKNTKGSGDITLNFALINPPGTTEWNCSVARTTMSGTTLIPAGGTSTITLSPDESGTGPPNSLGTGTTRTFTFQGTDGAIVVTTYTDS